MTSKNDSTAKNTAAFAAQAAISFGAALFAISLVALFCKVDIGGALPGIALLLPSVLLVAATETYSEVPWYAFALAGLPPLTVGLLAIPPLARTTGFWRGVLFWILCLGPTVASVPCCAAPGRSPPRRARGSRRCG